VAIWTSGGLLEVQATVPAGTSGTLLNGFRYTSVTPTLLLPGSYTIAGFSPKNGNNPDDVISFAAVVTTASGINYVDSRRDASGTQLTFPTGGGGHGGYFGPDFQFAGVPEPSSWALRLVAAGAFAVVTRRKKSR